MPVHPGVPFDSSRGKSLPGKLLGRSAGAQDDSAWGTASPEAGGAIDLVGVLGLLHQYEERVLLVDVRPRPQYETGHIPFSCPAYPPSCTCELSQELLAQVKQADVVVVLGVRGQDFSPFLAHFSQEARCPVFLYEGGISEWKGCGLPWEGEKTE